MDHLFEYRGLGNENAPQNQILQTEKCFIWANLNSRNPLMCLFYKKLRTKKQAEEDGGHRNSDNTPQFH